MLTKLDVLTWFLFIIFLSCIVFLSFVTKVCLQSFINNKNFFILEITTENDCHKKYFFLIPTTENEFEKHNVTSYSSIINVKNFRWINLKLHLLPYLLSVICWTKEILVRWKHKKGNFLEEKLMPRAFTFIHLEWSFELKI